MILENEIRRHAIAYLRNDISLDDLADWLVHESRDMHLDSAASAIELASSLDLALMEYSDDVLTEQQLRERMLEAISEVKQSVQLADNSSLVERPQPIRNSSRSVSLPYLRPSLA